MPCPRVPPVPKWPCWRARRTHLSPPVVSPGSTGYRGRPCRPHRAGTSPRAERREEEDVMRHPHKFSLIAASVVSASALALGPALLSAQASTVVRPTYRSPWTLPTSRPTDAHPAGRRDHRLWGQQASTERTLDRGRRPHSHRHRGRVQRLLHGRTGRGNLDRSLPERELRSDLGGQPAARLSGRSSPEGLASPLHQRGITNAGDPVQAWGLQGKHLDRHGQSVPGDDPRNAGGEGFDVHQCRTQDAAGVWSRTRHP